MGSAAHPARPRRARARRSARRRAGPYALQAAIAACHARARRAEDTDWARIAALYDALARAHAIAGRRAESRGRGVDGARAGGRPRDRRRARRRSRRSSAITSCRACAATSSPSSAATTRPAPSSSARPRSPATRASATSCSRAPLPSPVRSGRTRSHWTSG